MKKKKAIKPTLVSSTHNFQGNAGQIVSGASEVHAPPPARFSDLGLSTEQTKTRVLKMVGNFGSQGL